jgi:cystathionine beta-lyase
MIPAVEDPARMRAVTEFRLGSLRFHVEHRSLAAAGVGAAADDGGPSLRIRDAAGREILRFDCFRFSPHYHVIDRYVEDLQSDDDRDFVAFGPVHDPVSWTIEELSRDLPGYLARANYDGKLDWSDEALAETLAAAESALRNPPARLDDLDLATLKTRLSEKWNTYPSDIHAAWVAEMDFPLAEPIRRVLERAVDRSDIGYPIAPTDTGLREAFCDRMKQLYGWEPEPAQVEILTDVVQALYLGVLAYSEPGDGAVVQTSIYPPFFDAVRETGRRLVEHRLIAPRAGREMNREGYQLDLGPLQADVDERTRLLLFCNPHNPTGRVFRRDELEALAQLAQEQDWIVLSDEIHQDLVYPGFEHIPFATVSEDAAARTITITSATKGFNIPGLRTCVAHFGSAELQERFNTIVPRHVRGGIGLLGLYCTVAAWRHSDPWLAEVRTYLEGNRDFVVDFVTRELPEIRIQPAESTYFAWLDCRDLDLQPSPARFFYRHAKVALSDGGNFGPGWEGFARLNFATSRALLGEILEKLAKAIRNR